MCHNNNFKLKEIFINFILEIKLKVYHIKKNQFFFNQILDLHFDSFKEDFDKNLNYLNYILIKEMLKNSLKYFLLKILYFILYLKFLLK